MKRLQAFGRFWYDFVVGDDWRLAIGVVVALALTAGVQAATGHGWWVMPLSVVVLLPLSLALAVRQKR